MPPPLFADLFKTSNDLFVKDYKDLNPKLEATIGVINGTEGFTSELEVKRRFYDFDFTGKFNAKNEKVLTIENSTLVPNLKFKIENNLSKLSGEYKQKQFTSSASYDLSKKTGDITVVAQPTLSQQTGTLSIGVSQPYGKADPKAKDAPSVFLNPHFKAEYNSQGVEVGASVENYGKKIGLSVYQNVNSTLGVGVSVAQEGANLSLGLGGAFVPDKDTSIRGKVDSTGVISALYTQKIFPSATLKLLGQVDSQKLADGKAHKFGLNLIVKV